MTLNILKIVACNPNNVFGDMLETVEFARSYILSILRPCIMCGFYQFKGPNKLDKFHFKCHIKKLNTMGCMGPSYITEWYELPFGDWNCENYHEQYFTIFYEISNQKSVR